MKDNFYFQITGTENEHFFLEDIFREELEKRGYKLIYYRPLKNGHIAMRREAKTNAPRWVVLDVCMERNINIEAEGFLYKNGVQEKELYDWPPKY